MTTRQLNEPLYRIIKAQQANLARLETDLLLTGTDWNGDNIKLWGPKPDIIRLYDTPLRFIEGSVKNNWERIITITPAVDRTRAAIVSRTDRTFTYLINVLIQLLPSEIQADSIQQTSDAVRANNPLAQKSHKLLYDIHHLFYDDMELGDSEDDCNVMHSSYSVEWEPNVIYPRNMFVLTVTGEVAGW